MKNLFNYGIWLGAIASYALIFMDPTHKYVPYAKNIILIYEIFCWVLFVIMTFVTILFAVAKLKMAEMVKNGSSEQFKKALEEVKRKRLHHEILRYFHYLFIIFVGVFVGDISMTIILVLNSILYLIMVNLLRSILAEAANE